MSEGEGEWGRDLCEGEGEGSIVSEYLVDIRGVDVSHCYRKSHICS
jgi:hypothetical protein